MRNLATWLFLSVALIIWFLNFFKIASFFNYRISLCIRVRVTPKFRYVLYLEICNIFFGIQNTNISIGIGIFKTSDISSLVWGLYRRVQNQNDQWFVQVGTPIFRKLIFKLSLASNTVPCQWKQASIRPIPKWWSTSQHADLHPISITPIVSRRIKRTVVRT